MNSFKFSLLPLVGLILFFGLVVAGDLKSDLKELADREDGVRFNEDQIGYDNHADKFYYQDIRVNEEYEREKYISTKVTLAGQKPDSTNRVVLPAVNPFAVAMRSFKKIGIFMDRWDAKDTGSDVQYFALYHGRNNPFVVNKVRAHLLRTLANAVGDYMPSLNRIAQPGVDQEDPQVQLVLDDIRGMIETVFREVDDTVRGSMRDKDDSSASATVVIVTESHVITAGVGPGHVIAYNEMFETDNLSPSEDDKDEFNMFGFKRSRNSSIHPHVKFYPRDKGYQYLLMTTPSIAGAIQDEDVPEITDKELTRIVKSEIDQHKRVENQEQEIYSMSVQRIINKIENSLSAIRRFFKHSDYSLILVGLNTDYESIH